MGINHKKMIAVGLVEAIIIDLKDRKGLKNEWNRIDDDVQHEIRTRWREMAVSHLDMLESIVLNLPSGSGED